jgi:ribonuclease HI/exonuclease III
VCERPNDEGGVSWPRSFTHVGWNTRGIIKLDPHTPSSSRGEGSAVTAPLTPEDGASRVGNGSRATQTGRARADENATDGVPPRTGEEGPIPLQRTRENAPRHNGTKARIRIASLNIKGRRSGEIDKWMHLPQLMRDGGIGVMAVQEAHLTDELAEQFEGLFGNTFTLHHSPDPTTRNARGVAVVLNRRIIRADEATSTVLVPGRAMVTYVPWHDDQYIKILTIYAPNVPREAKEFWEAINTKINQSPNLNPDVMLGDFNIVEDALDRLPSKQDDAGATEALRDFRIPHDLVDGWRRTHPTTKNYTWSRESDGTQSRIDRIYIRENFLPDCNGWEIETPPIPTDHDIVSARITTPTTPTIGRGRWAIPARVFKDRSVKTEIQKLGAELERRLRTAQPRTPRENPQTWLREFKTGVMEAARRHEKTTQPKIKIRITKLTERLRSVRNDHSATEEEIKIAATQIKKEIQALMRETHQYKRDKQAAVDAAEGETVGKTWSNRFRPNKPRDTIKRLKDPDRDTTTRDAKEMAQIAARYHEEIQREGHDPQAPPDEQRLNEILDLLGKSLPAESRRKLSEKISEDEVREAVKSTPNDKAPGLDGIPIELWKTMDSQFSGPEDTPQSQRGCDIVWILTQVFQDIEVNGMDADARLNEGCMSPIFKKKDPENIANYRPITLLNTDYKIFTKALSTKLSETAPHVINTDQAGFIKGRSIFDQVKTTKLVIDYMTRSERPGAIVALDQEKAYDKILHPYLWAVLRKFGFPENLIKTIQSLYDNASTTVMINGELSDPFLVIRGVRQGDALSCLLFDLAIEPLAEMIRKSSLINGIQIPGTRRYLKVKMFADDTTVFLSAKDNIDDLQTLLANWCRVSGAKFNIEKTEIIPLGSHAQRENIANMRRLHGTHQMIPPHVHIAKDGEPVRILGAWLGNNVDQAVTWAPVVEDCTRRLRRWGASRHSLEGRRLIVQMQVAGVTQYLTKVQGMPKEVESDLDRQVRRFLWDNEGSDTVNRAQMSAPHDRGGKKMLNLEARNKAVHLTWLQAYLNVGGNRPTWAYFADAIIGSDIPKSQRVDGDPESRIMPILQTWQTRTRRSNLPEDLYMMLRLAKEFNVSVSAPNPSLMAKMRLPLWYHVHSKPAARKLYRTKTAGCLRRKHRVRLVQDAVTMLGSISNDHRPAVNCKCASCRSLRATEKCSHPFECINMAATLIERIHPEWNPLHAAQANPPHPPTGQEDPPGGGIVFTKERANASLRDTITIFTDPLKGDVRTAGDSPEPADPPPQPTTVYTDGACTNNGNEDAAAGLGVWFGENDPRNISMRVPLNPQTNQTGELMAVLLAVKSHPPNGDLTIASDSRYVIDGLTRNIKKWESRNWTDTSHGALFKCIAAWMRWRSGKTTLTWVKGHSGIAGNEGADKLAGEGARHAASNEPLQLEFPPGHRASGALLSKLEQRDFYRIINEKRPVPTRARADRNVALIQAGTRTAFDYAPTREAVWTATKHKDFTRKTRDFLWKATQNAYKIGEYWDPIEGYEDRGICPLCNEQEDMDHILTKCTSPARTTAWALANDVWRRRNESPLPEDLGGILGSGLAKFLRNGKPDRGKNRLFRILTSETAHLVWKMRNERQIRDRDGMTPPQSEITTRWTNAINKRLTIDRMLTDERRFSKWSLAAGIVRSTWKQCLRDEESLPTTWPKARGVLVGISPPCLSRRGDGTRSCLPRRGIGVRPRLPARGVEPPRPDETRRGGSSPPRRGVPHGRCSSASA